MKAISFIEDDVLIKKIMIHLGMWNAGNQDLPQLNIAHHRTIETELSYDYIYSQLSPIDHWTN